MRITVGYLSRTIFWITALMIILSAVLNLVTEHKYYYAIFAVIFFPITYFYYPFAADKLWLLVVSMLSYIISTLIGKMNPVD